MWVTMSHPLPIAGCMPLLCRSIGLANRVYLIPFGISALLEMVRLSSITADKTCAFAEVSAAISVIYFVIRKVGECGITAFLLDCFSSRIYGCSRKHSTTQYLLLKIWVLFCKVLSPCSTMRTRWAVAVNIHTSVKTAFRIKLKKRVAV